MVPILFYNVAYYHLGSIKVYSDAFLVVKYIIVIHINCMAVLKSTDSVVMIKLKIGSFTSLLIYLKKKAPSPKLYQFQLNINFNVSHLGLCVLFFGDKKSLMTRRKLVYLSVSVINFNISDFFSNLILSIFSLSYKYHFSVSISLPDVLKILASCVGVVVANQFQAYFYEFSSIFYVLFIQIMTYEKNNMYICKPGKSDIDQKHSFI